jgi:hypothetical protein
MLNSHYENKAVAQLSDRMRECPDCGCRWFMSPREAGRYRHMELPKRCSRCRELRRDDHDIDDAA